MSIQVQCQCGKTYSFKDEFAGSQAACPACGQAIQIPGVAPPPLPQAAAVGPPELPSSGRAKAPLSHSMIALLALIAVGLGAYWVLFRPHEPAAGVDPPVHADPGPASAPAARTADARSLAFEVTSAGTQPTYRYGDSSNVKTVGAKEGFELFVVKCTVSNQSGDVQHFSSGRFRVVDKGGQDAKADFLGFGDSVAENGVTLSVKGRQIDKTGTEIVNYKGKLNVNAAFMDWNLAPRQKFSETLIFIVPVGMTGLRCELIP
jgi:hypothetical protein